jgi:hypothetical protein
LFLPRHSKMFFSKSCALLALALFASGQSIPYTIQNLRLVGPPSLNYTSFDSIRNLGLTWEIVQANGVDLAFTFSTSVSTVELMQGTAAAASDTVIDVLCPYIFSLFPEWILMGNFQRSTSYLPLPPSSRSALLCQVGHTTSASIAS